MCLQRVFCQLHADFLSVHAQATTRFNETMHQIAQEAGGEGGCRLGCQLGIRRSADTYLRNLRQNPLSPMNTPRVVGIDDWAWHRGHRNGTIVCDLEQFKVIDILPDREVRRLSNGFKCILVSKLLPVIVLNVIVKPPRLLPHRRFKFRIAGIYSRT